MMFYNPYYYSLLTIWDWAELDEREELDEDIPDEEE